MRSETAQPGPIAIDFSRLPALEIAFCGFLFAGVFKADPRFAAIPVDLTLLFAVFTILLSFLEFRKPAVFLQQPVSTYLFALVAFHLWVGVTLLWSPSVSQSVSTFQLMLANHVPATLGALAIAMNPDRMRRFALIIAVFSVWVALETMLALFGNRGGEVFVRVLSGQYQLTSSAIAMGSVALIALAVNEKRLSLRIAYAVIAVLLLAITPTIGGRTSVIAAAAALGFLFVFGHAWKEGQFHLGRLFIRSSIVLAVGLSAALLLLAAVDSLPTGLQRIAFFIIDPSSAGGGRLLLWQQAINLWAENPIFGSGVGSFALLNGYGDIQGYYPHNMFLQVLAETGLVGIAMIVALISIAIRHGGPGETPGGRASHLIAACLLVYFAVQILGTGELVNRFFYAFLALLFVGSATLSNSAPRRRQNNTKPAGTSVST